MRGGLKEEFCVLPGLAKVEPILNQNQYIHSSTKSIYNEHNIKGKKSKQRQKLIGFR